jgi:UDP-N-acetylmuramate dehydrogenase
LGSIFKNPAGEYAGRLIEAAGLKGYSIGGAQVSPIHGNFFINTSHATATDYHALIRYVQEQVHKQTNIKLNMEVELIGEW